MRPGLAVLAIATAACGSAADAIADGTVELGTPAATTDAGPPLDDIGQIDFDSDRLCIWAEEATGGNIGDVRRGASHGTLPDGRVVVEPDYPNPSHELFQAVTGTVDSAGADATERVARECLPPITGLAAERHAIDWETGERFPLPDDVDLDDLGPQPDQLDSSG